MRRAFEHQREAADPAVRTIVEAADVGGVQRRALCRERRGFVGREPKIRPADRREVRVGEVRQQHGRRLGPAHEDEVGVLRNLGEGHADHVEDGTVLRQRLAVVEHDERPGRDHREQRAEIAAREAGQVGQVLGGQQRQGALPGDERPRRLGQVVEERRDIRVAGVHLHPEDREVAGRAVAREQRRLARPRWTRDPDGRMRALRIEQGHEPLASHRAMEPRRRQLRQASLRTGIRGRRCGPRAVIGLRHVVHPRSQRR
jgi:hypothetical protein